MGKKCINRIILCILCIFAVELSVNSYTVSAIERGG